MICGKPHSEQDRVVRFTFPVRFSRVCRKDRWLPSNCIQCNLVQNPAYKCACGPNFNIVFSLDFFMIKKNQFQKNQFCKNFFKKNFISKNFYTKDFVRKIFWMFPFISFLIGYFFFYFLIHKKEVITPRLIGRTIQTGLMNVSKNGLNVRLLREKEDVDLPAGIVIEQIPGPGQRMRPNQHVFVVVSKKPKVQKAPDVVGSKVSDITKQLSKIGVQHNSFFLSSLYPKETCIAQTPRVGSLLTKRKLTTYISEGTTKLFIVPDLCGRDFDEVKEFLENEKVTVDVFYAKKKSKKNFTNIVSDQKPMPGSIVDLSKPLFMQLQVR